MKVQALHRGARLAPSKAAPLARKLGGLPIEQALAVVSFSRLKAARIIRKTLQSAMANVENNAKMPLDAFYVEAVLVEKGPLARRYWARSRGMARPIRKATSHIRVILSNEHI